MNKHICLLLAVILVSGIGIVSAESNASLPTTVTVTTPAIVAIAIQEKAIDFGVIGAGETSARLVHIDNKGTVNINVDIIPNQMDGSIVGNFIPASAIITKPDPILNIPVKSTGTSNTTLSVPVGQAPDAYSGSIDFIATGT